MEYILGYVNDYIRILCIHDLNIIYMMSIYLKFYLGIYLNNIRTTLLLLYSHYM